MEEQLSETVLPIVIRRSYTAMAFWGVVGEVLYVVLFFAVLVAGFVLYQMTQTIIPALVLIALVPLVVSVIKVVFYIYGILHWMEISYTIEPDLIRIKRGENVEQYSMNSFRVDSEQDWLGKLLGYGKLVLILNNGQNVKLEYISHPQKYEEIIKKVQQMKMQ